ncbi:MAG TPA: phospholipase A [Burkholderiales bacterium]|nr:phospholipase A [Burkholderiales bacterium]
MRSIVLGLALLVLAPLAQGQEKGLWEKKLEDDASRESLTFSAREPNYILFTYMSSPNKAPYRDLIAQSSKNELDKAEIKFQLALQTKAADNLFGGNGDLWFAYTQVSYWQTFNNETGAFRESNYEPEVYLSFLTDYKLLGLKLRTVDAGLVHQSNGRAGLPSARSWNRAFANFMFVRGDFALGFKPWVRFSEDAATDDNPDIENYLGHYELRLLYAWKRQIFSAMLRNITSSEHRINSELNWSFPIARRLRGLVQYYHGYGESLVDYNYNMNRIGIGVLLTDWL